MKILIRDLDSSSTSKLMIKEFPCSIGRAESCHVRLPHESISANHAVIEQRDDQFFVRDLESRNGVSVQGERISTLPLQTHSVFSLGRIEIEILDLSTNETEVTKPLQAPRLKKEYELPLALIGLSALPLNTYLNSYFLGSAAVGLAMLAVAFLIFCLVLFTACSAWIGSFFSADHRFKSTFKKIFFINCTYTGVYCAFVFTSKTIAFNLDSAEVWTWIRTVCAALMMAVFLTAYCKSVFFRGRRKTLAIVAATVVATVGFSFTALSYLYPESARFESAITQPLREFTQSNRSIAEFNAKMKASFEKVEAVRAKAYEKSLSQEADAGP